MRSIDLIWLLCYNWRKKNTSRCIGGCIMFENITEKIRVMAKVLLVLGAVGWIVIGIAFS